MDAAGIIDFARKLSGGVTSGQISDTDALPILNKAYKDFYQRIVSLDKNYFRDQWTTDLIQDQYEYAILQPDSSTSTFGQYKPEGIRIKYPLSTKFVDVFLTDWDALDYTPEWLAANQPKLHPLAVITDTRYVHIFPTPTDNVIGGLIFEGAKKPFELTTTSTEADILIEPLYHEVIAYLMKPMFYEYKLLEGESQVAEAKAEREIQKALKAMGVLKTKAIRASVKNLSHLE